MIGWIPPRKTGWEERGQNVSEFVFVYLNTHLFNMMVFLSIFSGIYEVFHISLITNYWVPIHHTFLFSDIFALS